MLRVEHLKKTFYPRKNVSLNVLSDILFELADGEKLALQGASGAGKSTIARILTGLETPDGGNVILDGKPLWSDDRKRKYDRTEGRKIQMIFQSPYASLDPMQKAGDAVAEALVFSRRAKRGKEAREGAEELFDLVGLPRELTDRRPFALSGGQAQRVAVARALALSPSVLIADEATAMLDVTTQARIIELLNELNEKLGLSLLFISHDEALLKSCAHKILRLADGAVTEEDNETN